jgi:hypothetical protein
MTIVIIAAVQAVVVVAIVIWVTPVTVVEACIITSIIT